MNLVQTSERLKDLPTQVIQQYANGMNPEIPPYLALGELQRRETAQKQMATAQGAAQGPQPSIKEQIEQKAGLMAAQGLQQQQMMEQMAQQRVPGPVPAGMPQPTDQPEAQPTMMARGGLARAPVNFNFQHGGIVAFNGEDGSEVKKDKYETPYDRRNREIREAEARRKREFDAFNEQLRADPAQVKMREEEQAFDALSPAGRSAERGQQLREFFKNVVASPPAAVVQAPMAAPARPAAENRALLNKADAALRAAPGTPAAPAAPIADLKTLAEQKQRQQNQRPAATPAVTPAAPAAPAQPDPNSMDAMLRAQLGRGTKETTLAEQLAEQQAAREGAGMTGPAGAAQMERLRKLQEQYESSKPTAFQDFIRVLGQSAQYKGMSGIAPAYTANLDQKRAADLAMAEKMNTMMSGVETTQRGEQAGVASGALAGLAGNRTARAGEDKDRLSALGTGRGQDMTASTAEAQRKTQERGQDIQVKVAAIQAAATREARAQGADDKTIAAAEAAFARDPEAKALAETLKMFALNPTSPNYQSALQKLQAIQASKYKQFGITLEGAPGAASPGGNRPPLSSFQR